MCFSAIAHAERNRNVHHSEDRRLPLKGEFFSCVRQGMRPPPTHGRAESCPSVILAFQPVFLHTWGFRRPQNVPHAHTLHEANLVSGHAGGGGSETFYQGLFCFPGMCRDGGTILAKHSTIVGFAECEAGMCR